MSVLRAIKRGNKRRREQVRRLSRQPRSGQRFRVESLEPRILLSGDPGWDLDDTAVQDELNSALAWYESMGDSIEAAEEFSKEIPLLQEKTSDLFDWTSRFQANISDPIADYLDGVNPSFDGLVQYLNNNSPSEVSFSSSSDSDHYRIEGTITDGLSESITLNEMLAFTDDYLGGLGVSLDGGNVDLSATLDIGLNAELSGFGIEIQEAGGNYSWEVFPGVLTLSADASLEGSVLAGVGIDVGMLDVHIGSYGAGSSLLDLSTSVVIDANSGFWSAGMAFDATTDLDYALDGAGAQFTLPLEFTMDGTDHSLGDVQIDIGDPAVPGSWDPSSAAFDFSIGLPDLWSGFTSMEPQDVFDALDGLGGILRDVANSGGLLDIEIPFTEALTSSDPDDPQADQYGARVRDVLNFIEGFNEGTVQGLVDAALAEALGFVHRQVSDDSGLLAGTMDLAAGLTTGLTLRVDIDGLAEVHGVEDGSTTLDIVISPGDGIPLSLADLITDIEGQIDAQLGALGVVGDVLEAVDSAGSLGFQLANDAGESASLTMRGLSGFDTWGALATMLNTHLEGTGLAFVYDSVDQSITLQFEFEEALTPLEADLGFNFGLGDVVSMEMDGTLTVDAGFSLETGLGISTAGLGASFDLVVDGQAVLLDVIDADYADSWFDAKPVEGAPDLHVVSRDGTSFDVTFESPAITTVTQLVAAFNDAAIAEGASVRMSVDAAGDRFILRDFSAPTVDGGGAITGSFSVTALNDSAAGEALGLVQTASNDGFFGPREGTVEITGKALHGESYSDLIFLAPTTIEADLGLTVDDFSASAGLGFLSLEVGSGTAALGAVVSMGLDGGADNRTTFTELDEAAQAGTPGTLISEPQLSGGVDTGGGVMAYGSFSFEGLSADVGGLFTVPGAAEIEVTLNEFDVSSPDFSPDVEVTGFSGLDGLGSITAIDVWNMLVELGPFLDGISSGEILDIPVPFTDGATLGDALDFAAGLSDTIVDTLEDKLFEEVFAGWDDGSDSLLGLLSVSDFLLDGPLQEDVSFELVVTGLARVDGDGVTHYDRSETVRIALQPRELEAGVDISESWLSAQDVVDEINSAIAELGADLEDAGVPIVVASLDGDDLELRIDSNVPGSPALKIIEAALPAFTDIAGLVQVVNERFLDGSIFSLDYDEVVDELLFSVDYDFDVLALESPLDFGLQDIAGLEDLEGFTASVSGDMQLNAGVGFDSTLAIYLGALGANFAMGEVAGAGITTWIASPQDVNGDPIEDEVVEQFFSRAYSLKGIPSIEVDHNGDAIPYWDAAGNPITGITEDLVVNTRSGESFTVTVESGDAAAGLSVQAVLAAFNSAAQAATLPEVRIELSEDGHSFVFFDGTTQATHQVDGEDVPYVFSVSAATGSDDAWTTPGTHSGAPDKHFNYVSGVASVLGMLGDGPVKIELANGTYEVPAETSFVGQALHGEGVLDRLFLRDTVLEGSIEASADVTEASLGYGMLTLDATGISGSLGAEVSMGLLDGSLAELADLISSGGFGQLFADGVVFDGAAGGSLSIDGVSLAGFDLVTPGEDAAIAVVVEGMDPSALDFDVDIDFSALGAQLESFQNLSFDQIIAGLRGVIDSLQEFQSTELMQTEIPGINVSLGDTLNFADDLLGYVENFEENAQGALESIEGEIESIFGLPDEAFELTYAASAVPGVVGEIVMALQWSLEDSDSVELGFDFNSIGSWLGLEDDPVFDFLGDLVSVSGGTTVGYGYEAAVMLELGIELSLDSLPRTFIGEATGLTVGFGVSADDVEFEASVGPLSLEVRDGYIGLHAEGDEDEYATFTVDVGSGERIYLDEALADPALLAPQFGFDGEFTTRLPFNVPLVSEPMEFSFTVGDLRDIVNTVTWEFPDFSEIELPAACDLINDPGFVLDGVEAALLSVQSFLDEATALNLPFVGDQIGEAFTFIDDIRTNLVDPARTILEDAEASGWDGNNGTDADGTIQSDELLTGMLTDLIASSDLADWVESGPLIVLDGCESLEATIVLGNTFTVDADLSFDLGLPGLDLSFDGDFQLEAGFTFRFGIGLDLTGSDGVYLITDWGGEEVLDVEVDATFGADGSDFELAARLGFIAARAQGVSSAEDDGLVQNAARASFTIDFSDAVKDVNSPGGDRLTVAEISQVGAGVLDVHLGFETNLDLGLLLEFTDFSGNALTGFPNFSAGYTGPGGFVVDASVSKDFEDGAWSETEVSYSGEIEKVNLNLGTFASELLTPALEVVNDALAPVKPVIDLLTDPIPGLSDIGTNMSIMDVISAVPGAAGNLAKFVSFVASTLDLYEESQANGGELFITLIDSATFGNSGWDMPLAPSYEELPTSGFLQTLKDLHEDGILQFPFLFKADGSINPGPIFTIITGGDLSDIDFVVIDPDPVSIGYGISNSGSFSLSDLLDLPVDVGISISWNLSLGAIFEADFAFGYDGYGIQKFLETDNGAYLLDGFYISDNIDEDGVDQPELRLFAGIDLEASVTVDLWILEATGWVDVYLGGEVYLDLNDPNDDGKMRMSELWSVLSSGSPQCMFDFGGRIAAELSVGVYGEFWAPFSWYDFSLSATLLDVTFYEFEISCDDEPAIGVMNGSALTVLVGPNSAIGVDGDDVVQITDAGGDSVLVNVPGLGQKEFSGVESIILDMGNGNDSLSIGSGVSAAVDAKGGSGNDLLSSAGDGVAYFRGGEGNDTLTGGSAADTLDGEAGDDSLTGSGGHDLIYGRSGNDIARGGEGDDSLYGEDGLDSLFGDLGADSIFGGIGDDYLLGGDDSVIDVIFGGDGHDNISTGGGANRAYGEDGDDTIAGGADGDLLEGGPGADSISGAGGADTISGATGDDTLDGGDGADSISGGVDEDLITAGAGNDSVTGDEGDDSIFGGPGADRLDGSRGDDQITGGDDSSTLIGGTGEDTITGGSSGDYIEGGSEEDLISAGDGDDLIYAGTGADFVSAGAGNDTVYGESEDDVIYGDDGDDVLDGGYGVDSIEGGAGADSILGADGADILQGGEGDDTIKGGAGADTLEGGDGSDYLFGEQGTADGALFAAVQLSTLLGDSAGSDLISGGSGDDYLAGGAGDDTINGGDGSDVIFGDLGQSIFGTGESSTTDIAVAGADLLSGDLGDDIIFGGGAGDAIHGGGGADAVLGDFGSMITLLSGGLVSITSSEETGGDDVITLGDGDDTAIGGASSDSIYGGEGDDLLAGDYAQVEYQAGGLRRVQSSSPESGDGDFISGEAGDDLLIGGYGSDILEGGEDQDVLHGDNAWGEHTNGSFTGTGTMDPGVGDADTVTGDAGDDVVFGSVGGDYVTGDFGDDLLAGDYGQYTYDAINGWQFSSTDNVDGDHADSLFGDEGDDVIIGGLDSDLLQGSSGDDILLGDRGAWSLEGQIRTVGTVEPTIGGADEIYGGEGSDMAFGGVGADLISGDSGDDYLIGDFGDAVSSVMGEVIFIGTSTPGQGGKDTITGEAGNDFLFGGFEQDHLEGGTEDDVLVGDYAELNGDPTAAAQLVTTGLATGEGEAGLEDVLLGGDGNDALIGGFSADVLRGESGDDIVIGDQGSLDWGGGMIVRAGTMDPSAGASETLEGGAGNDVLLAGAGNDELRGETGDDVLFGDFGFVEFSLGVPIRLQTTDADFGGDDLLLGAIGDDTGIGGLGEDLLYGHEGDDLLMGDYAVVLRAAGIPDEVTSPENGPGGEDTIYGDVGDDREYGGPQRDTMWGNADDDEMHGGSGSDLMFADEGGFEFTDGEISLVDGAIVTEGGDDWAEGNAGDDTIVGAGGDDVLHGGNADASPPIFGSDRDVVFGDFGIVERSGGVDVEVRSERPEEVHHDEVYGEKGKDTLFGGSGNDTLDGGGGKDVVFGDHGVTQNVGGEWILAEPRYLDAGSSDTAHGGAGDDVIFGGLGDSEAHGDHVEGDGGDDIVSGDFGHVHRVDEVITAVDQHPWWLGEGDELAGGLGDDWVLGGRGGDVAYGAEWQGTEDSLGSDRDLVIGDFANLVIPEPGGFLEHVESRHWFPGEADELHGGPDKDSIIGGAGSDVMYGDQGDDHMMADWGYFWWSTPMVLDEMRTEDISPIDVTDDTANTLSGGDGSDVMVGGIWSDELAGNGGDDFLFSDHARFEYREDGRRHFYESREPNFGESDVLVGGSGDDVTVGGKGSDVLSDGSGWNYLVGDNGRVDFAEDESIAVVENTDPRFGEADLITGGSGRDHAYGGLGDDVITLFGHRDVAFGDGGRVEVIHQVVDRIQVTDPAFGGNDTIDGGSGNDTLLGGHHDDDIFGDSGSDLIFGDHGAIHFEDGYIRLIEETDPGQFGDDFIDGGSGSDSVYEGGGNDTVINANAGSPFTGGTSSNGAGPASAATGETFLGTRGVNGIPGWQGMQAGSDGNSQRQLGSGSGRGGSNHGGALGGMNGGAGAAANGGFGGAVPAGGAGGLGNGGGAAPAAGAGGNQAPVGGVFGGGLGWGNPAAAGGLAPFRGGAPEEVSMGLASGASDGDWMVLDADGEETTLDELERASEGVGFSSDLMAEIAEEGLVILTETEREA